MALVRWCPKKYSSVCMEGIFAATPCYGPIISNYTSFPKPLFLLLLLLSIF